MVNTNFSDNQSLNVDLSGTELARAWWIPPYVKILSGGQC